MVLAHERRIAPPDRRTGSDRRTGVPDRRQNGPASYAQIGRRRTALPVSRAGVWDRRIALHDRRSGGADRRTACDMTSDRSPPDNVNRTRLGAHMSKRYIVELMADGRWHKFLYDPNTGEVQGEFFKFLGTATTLTSAVLLSKLVIDDPPIPDVSITAPSGPASLAL